MIAKGRRPAYWHSENVTCYVTVDQCPSCAKEHSVVVLYVDENHQELKPNDFLNDVFLPCGALVDIVLERTDE